MLVGNNIALVIYGILMAQIIEVNLLAGMIDNHFVMVLVQTIISTLVILVTGEFLPKTLFKINPNLVLRVFAIPLFVCYVILFPISKFASGHHHRLQPRCKACLPLSSCNPHRCLRQGLLYSGLAG